MHLLLNSWDGPCDLLLLQEATTREKNVCLLLAPADFIQGIDLESFASEKVYDIQL